MDAHDRRTRALLALVLADQDAVKQLTANHGDVEHVGAWLREQGHDAERAELLAPHLHDALKNMTAAGVVNADRRR